MRMHPVCCYSSIFTFWHNVIVISGAEKTKTEHFHVHDEEVVSDFRREKKEKKAKKEKKQKKNEA